MYHSHGVRSRQLLLLHQNKLYSSLVHFDLKKPLVVVADSSAYGIGAVLCHSIDGEERPICFASRTLFPAERNYAQLEKEALAMVFALRKFHYYLWGQANFTLVTDHKPFLAFSLLTRACLFRHQDVSIVGHFFYKPIISPYAIVLVN